MDFTQTQGTYSTPSKSILPRQQTIVPLLPEQSKQGTEALQTLLLQH